MPTSRIAQLALQITENTNKVDEYLQSKSLPQPSFDAAGPTNLGIESAEIEHAKNAAIEASIELQDLLEGPVASVRPVLNATSLQAIYKYEIAGKVPIDGEISFVELAKLCDLPEPDVRRILRFAMCYHRCFYEPRKGYVAHTVASRHLAESLLMQDGMGLMFDETYQAFAHTVEAMQRFKSQEPNETGHALAHGVNQTLYEYLGDNPDKAKRFANAMTAFTSDLGLSPQFVVDGYPWHTIRGGKGKIVDLGGSNGTICIALAETHPHLHFVVQDLPEVVKHASPPSHLGGRVEFMAHDFFTEQPVEADVYFFRYIFHNWPDSYVVKILRQLIPSLKPGARVIINDQLMPEPNTLPLRIERRVRGMDMIMLSLCNARERERDDWVEIFKNVDERFKLVNAWVPKGSALGLVEVVWEG